MLQVTYVSDAANNLGPDDLFRVIEASSRNNLRDDLTGFLVFARDRFFQLVEGPENAIEALFSRLARDPRHTAINILRRETIAERAFPRWQMKRLGTGADLTRALAEGANGGKVREAIRADLFQFLELDHKVSA